MMSKMNAIYGSRVCHQWWVFTIALVAVMLLPEWAFSQERVKLKGVYQIQKGTRLGWIILQAEILPDHYIYGLTQKTSAPKSKIKVAVSKQFDLIKEFAPSRAPVAAPPTPGSEAPVNRHHGKIAFLAPIRVAEGTDPAELEIEMKFHGQVCSASGCFPLFDKSVTVAFGGFYEPENSNPAPKQPR